MLQIEISIIIAAIIINLNLTLINIIKRFRYTVNRLFAVITFLGAILSLTIFFQLINYDSSFLIHVSRSSFAILLLVCLLTFCLSQIFPRWEKRSPTWFIVISSLPGIAVIILTVITDLVFIELRYDGRFIISYGSYALMYGITFGFYFIGCYSVFLYKYRNLENESFKPQLFHTLMGISAGSSTFIVLTVILPYLFNNNHFSIIGIGLSNIILVIICNYAVSDERVLNFRQFYIRVIYWLITSLILLFPLYSGLKYSSTLFQDSSSASQIGISILIFLLLSIFFRYVSPQIEKLFKIGYKSLEREFNESLQGITNITDNYEDVKNWDDIFSEAIDALETRFGISRISLYLYNVHEKEYLYSYGLGEKFGLKRIDEDSILLKCSYEYYALIEKSMLYTDEKLEKYKEQLLEILNNNGIQIIMPLFNYEKKIIGILLLGKFKGNKPYYMEFLSLLEIYRIQFGISLANSIMLKETKAKQIIAHDKIVVRTIKKKIMPIKLGQIEGLRVSSFFQNNSEYGGDYFNTIKIAPDKLGLFIADTGDAGIDSAVLALEIFSILQTQSKKYNTPEKMLNNINRVVTFSRFSDRYAQAFYMIYSSSSGELTCSNAAFNPVILFDTVKMDFQELDTDGIPVGIDKNFSYKYINYKVQPDSIGIFYSNGITAAMNSEGENYSIDRIKNIIANNKNDTPAVLVRKVYTDFKNFRMGVELLNDASLIIFRIR